MNQDELMSLVTKVAVAAFASYAGAYGVTPNDIQSIVGDVGTLASIGFGVYQHWNMKKVPETAVAVQPSTAAGPAVVPAVGSVGSVVGKVVG